MNLCVTVEGSPRVNALPSSSSSTCPEMSNKSNPVSLLPHLVCSNNVNLMRRYLLPHDYCNIGCFRKFFEFQQGHQLFWLRFFMFSSDSPIKCRKIGSDQFHSGIWSLLEAIALSFHSRQNVATIDTASLNSLLFFCPLLFALGDTAWTPGMDVGPRSSLKLQWAYTLFCFNFRIISHPQRCRVLWSVTLRV